MGGRKGYYDRRVTAKGISPFFSSPGLVWQRPSSKSQWVGCAAARLRPVTLSWLLQPTGLWFCSLQQQGFHIPRVTYVHPGRAT